MTTLRRFPIRPELVLTILFVPALARADDATPSPPKIEPAPAAEAPPERRTMTLDEAVKRSIDRNPTMEFARQEIGRAEALVRQARATWLPTFSANGTYTRLDDDRVLGDRVILGANSIAANVTLTVPIVAGRQWAAHARRKDEAEIARTSADDVKRTVALATGRAYLTVLAQKRVVDSAKRARDTAKAHESFSKERLAGGVGNRLDAVRASQERATAEAQVQTQLIALARAQEALGVLVGEQTAVDAADEAPLPNLPNLPTALGEADKRVDVVAQRDRTESARKAVRDSYTDYLPVLSAIGQPFYQNPATLTQPTTGWQAQLVLSIPLYDGGNRYGLKEERDALYAQQKTKVDAALRQARSEVRLAFESMQHADEALVQARDASKLATEALELAQLAYRSGATSNLEVIDAESRSRQAATAAVVAEDAARQARLELLAACGRFPAP